MKKLLLLMMFVTGMVAISMTGANAQCNLGTYYTTVCAGFSTTSTQLIPNQWAGEYITVNGLVPGVLYQANTCNSPSTYDTELTIRNAVGNGLIAYNDDACGTESIVQFTAPASGSVNIQLNQYHWFWGWCQTNSTNTRVDLRLVNTWVTPTPTASTPNPGCGSVTLSRPNPGTGITYFWQVSASGTDVGNSSPTWTVSSPGTYYLRARNSCGNWATASSISVSLNPHGVDGTIAQTPTATSICLGQSITVTPTGGTGTPYYWVQNPPGNATWNVFTQAAPNAPGNGFTFTPASAGTYRIHARWSTGCGFCWDHPSGSGVACSTFAAVDVVVTAPPAQPTFTASQTPACSGLYYTYTVLPTSGSGLTYNWSYSGTQLGLSGTSSTVNFAPITAGTLTVTPSLNGCPGTPRTLDITVDQPSVGGTLSADQTICAGEIPNTINLSGHTGSIVRWDVGVFPSSWSAIPGSAGWTSFSPSQIFETTMYVVTVKNGVCPQATSSFVTLTTPPLGTDEAQNGESASCSVTVNGFIHLREPGSGRLIASINSGGQNLGTVSATAYVAGAPIPVQACGTTQPWYITDVLGRHWVISATNPPASPVTVRLYFDNSELASLISSSTTNANPNDDVNDITWMDLSRYSNTVNVDSDPLNNCSSGTTTVHTQTAAGTTNLTGMGLTGFNASGRYVEYQIPGFSEFWLSGTNNVSPLPIELVSFTATCLDGTVRVDWTTASEINNEQFVIEKSANLQDWEQVTTVQGAGNSNQPLSYSVVDDRPLEGYSYYRLTQYDYDGQNETFEPVAVLCTGTTSITVFPNPTEGIVYVQGSFTGTVSCSLVDATGKPVHQSTIVGTGQMHTYVFDYSNLPAGVYTLQLREVPAVVKVIIAK